MHVNLLGACWHLEAMKGSSSLTSCSLLILSRLSFSLIWAKLTLLVPALGTQSPSLQNGDPIHRVRACSLTGIRNSYIVDDTLEGKGRSGRKKVKHLSGQHFKQKRKGKLWIEKEGEE